MSLPGWWDWKWFITTLVAVYAASLATYQAVRKWQETRPGVRVRLKLSMMLIDNGAATPSISVSIQNRGFREVSFDRLCCAIQVKGASQLLVMAKPITSAATFPFVLKGGSSFDMLSAMSSFKQGLEELGVGRSVKVRAVVYDQLNRPYRSKWIRAELLESEVVQT